ncbi:efflux RND transporter periplasmic adaptor subunit, partial [Oleiphilus sp. HI0061]
LLAYQISQSQPPASKGRPSKANPLLVEVDKIAPRDFQVTVESYGVLKANTRTNLLSLVSGQVLKVSPAFQRGAFVQEGQVLLVIDPLEYEVSLQTARSDLANAELALAEEEARSEQALRDWRTQEKINSTPARDYALRYPQLKAAKAKLETAKAKLSLAQKNLERTKVRAPYDGRLIETFVNKGSVISTSTPVAELYSSESLELSLPIASRDLAFLDLPSSESYQDTSSSAYVRIENSLVVPAEYWQAMIVGTEALVDAENQQIYALAKIVKPLTSEKSERPVQALKVGQYLHANIQGKTIDEAILVPNSAIYQGTYVYVVEKIEKQDVLARREVNVRWRNEELSLIESGLNIGDLLVRTPLGQVTSGTRVAIDKRVEGAADKHQGESP